MKIEGKRREFSRKKTSILSKNVSNYGFLPIRFHVVDARGCTVVYFYCGNYHMIFSIRKECELHARKSKMV